MGVGMGVGMGVDMGVRIGVGMDVCIGVRNLWDGGGVGVVGLPLIFKNIIENRIIVIPPYGLHVIQTLASVLSL